MRIGVFFPTKEHTPLDETVAHMVEIAGLGFSSVWLPQSSGFDALTVLALVGRETTGRETAGRATRVELGTSVVPTYPRHPVALAAQALTVNAATGSRLVLGIGLSHRVTIERTYGMSYDRPARHMREYLDVLAPLLRDRAVDVDGETVSAHAQLTMPDATAPTLLLAALQPRMLALAGGGRRRHHHVVHRPGHARAAGGAAPAGRGGRRRTARAPRGGRAADDRHRRRSPRSRRRR